jgi:hypothetical protein
MTKQKKEARFNLLIDAWVWLDVAKDYQQQAILAARGPENAASPYFSGGLVGGAGGNRTPRGD